MICFYKNQLDFAFLAESIEDSNLRNERFIYQQVYNPISQKKSVILKELSQQKLILLDSEEGLKGWILEICKSNNIDFNFTNGFSLFTIR